VNLNLYRERLVACQNSLTLKLVVGLKNRGRKPSGLKRLGSDYGGWWVPKNLLRSNIEDVLVISAGLGLDVSFDKALLELGIRVIGVDPIPKSQLYVEVELASFTNFYLEKKGIWTNSGLVIFNPPVKHGNFSWSISETQNPDHLLSKQFEVTTLHEILSRVKNHSKVEYLYVKMDIEGAEERLLMDTNFSALGVDFLAVEMDFLSRIPFRNFPQRIGAILRARKILIRLVQQGLVLVHTEGFNFFWQSNRRNA
jgi:FkbM family methyltransferase